MRIVIFLLCFFASACQTTKDIDIWPLVYYDQDSEKQTTQLDIMSSLYSYKSTPTEESHAFRPFVVSETAKDREESQLLFLWPFIRYHKKPNDALVSIIPFYYSRNLYKPEVEERDYDWFFLPFAAFGGTDTKEGPYFYLGFWGNIKGLLGYDEITGKPFPFYVTARDGDYFSRGYMWPFFRFGEGGGKKFEFYAFLYSYFEKEGKYVRRSYMWPFIHYNKEDLDSKHPRTEFMFFPFYGQSTSDQSLAWMFLWPFISYSSHENGYREYNLPWPFFKYRTGEGVDEFRIWPLYWHNKQQVNNIKHDDHMVMWPFFWSLHSDYPTHTKDSLYLAPFYSQHWRKGKDTNAQQEMRLKIWPLYEYEKKEDGSLRSRILSPLWFDDYFPEGFEKSWLPLFTFFDYSKDKDGKALSFLGPLYTFQKNEDLHYQRLLFFSYKNKTKDNSEEGRFSILGGLFEYNWQQKQNGIRLLYIPIPIWSKE